MFAHGVFRTERGDDFRVGFDVRTADQVDAVGDGGKNTSIDYFAVVASKAAERLRDGLGTTRKIYDQRRVRGRFAQHGHLTRQNGGWHKIERNAAHLFGIHLSYKVQPSPDGLAQAFLLGEEFIGDDCCAMVLGDNIFYGSGFRARLKQAAADAQQGRASIFGYYVNDPERFGIVEFDENGKVISVEEKPQHPKSNYCITGLYFYDNRVVDMAKRVKPSARGELEITDLNRFYLEDGTLNVQLLSRGYAWLDTGTMDSLVDAADFVRTIETRQGSQIAALEEIAFTEGWIDRETLLQSAQRYGKSPYGQHLMHVAEGKIRY